MGSKKRQTRGTRRAFLLIMGVILLSGLFSGCGSEAEKPKYKVDYCGQKYYYADAQDEYEAGAEVALYYGFVATDTDYSFFLDGERLNYGFDDQGGLWLRFIMPDRDVRLECVSRNSMEYDPGNEDPTKIVGNILVDYYHATVGTDGGDDHYEMVLTAVSDEDMVRLDVYSAPAGEEETCVSYMIPREAADRCFGSINETGLEGWNDREDADQALDGTLTAVKFITDSGEYVRVSTDMMPEGGERDLDSIKIILSEYLKDEYRCD